MKKLTLILSVFTLINLAGWLLAPVHAQMSAGNVIVMNAVPIASCVWPAVTPLTNTLAICATTTGLATASNGGTFSLLGVGGVVSFNGRTGVVIPVEADYANLLKFSDLAAPPTSVTAGTFSVTSATIK